MEDLDPEEARAIIDPALKLMIDAVRRYDGYVVQSTGDGIFALFGAPVAHEDHPQRALYAALRMQEELRGYGAKLQADGRAPVEIRVGVNTGEVVVRSITTGAGQVEYTPIGHTTNLASRLQTLAPTGSIVVERSHPQTVRRLLHPQAARRDQSQRRQRAGQRLRSDRPGAAAHAVAALGRARADQVRRARARDGGAQARRRAGQGSGRGQIVAAMAEPGVGKSRLFFEFKATSQSGWMVLETFSVSHGKASAYLPVIDLLHNYFEIASEDDERTRRARRSPARSLALDRDFGRHAALPVQPARHRRGRRPAGADGRAGSRSGARWRRSNASCCASRSISR